MLAFGGVCVLSFFLNAAAPPAAPSQVGVPPTPASPRFHTLISRKITPPGFGRFFKAVAAPYLESSYTSRARTGEFYESVSHRWHLHDSFL